MTSDVLLIGAGSLGAAVGLRLADLGHDVLALRRNADQVPAPLRGRSVDLTGSQFTVLIGAAYTQGENGVTIRQLADHVQLAATHVTTEVGRMCRLGLLKKRVNALDDGSGPAAVGALDDSGWYALAATVAAAVVAVLVVGEPRRSAVRVTDEELLDYERQAIPFGSLTFHDGTSASLAELGRTQARLLVVLNPSCGPCTRIAERLDGWAARLAPAVGVVAIYPDQHSASGATEHAPELAAWEPELNVRRVFSVSTPAAILLGADGFLAGGPVTGEDDVAAFVAEVLDAVSEQPSPTE